MSPVPERPARHGPCRFTQYGRVHETTVEQFRASGFVRDDTLVFVDFGSAMELSGEIACLGQLVVRVETFLSVIDHSTCDPVVQTEMYSYAVGVRGVGPVFRYDNQHPGFLRSGHADPHHRHSYDWPTPRESVDSPEWIGADRWPTLRDVLEEARVWHSDHYGELESPDRFARDLQPGGITRS